MYRKRDRERESGEGRHEPGEVVIAYVSVDESVVWRIKCQLISKAHSPP